MLNQTPHRNAHTATERHRRDRTAERNGKRYRGTRSKELKMKIPKYIRISGIDYDIQESEHLHSEDRMLYGQVDYAKSVIRLNSGSQNHQYKSVTLWHEVLHAIAHHANIDLGKKY